MTSNHFFSVEFKQWNFIVNRSERIYSNCDLLFCVMCLFMFALLFFLRLEDFVYYTLRLEWFICPFTVIIYWFLKFLRELLFSFRGNRLIFNKRIELLFNKVRLMTTVWGRILL